MWFVFLLAGIAAVVFLVGLYKSGFTVNRDDFKKTVWIHSNNKGGSSALGMQYWLRAFYVEGSLSRIQLYCSSREKDWRFYKSATGEDSTELEFISVDTDVADANVNIGGSVDTIEKFALNIPIEYLRKMAEKDWKIKVYGKRGQEAITVKRKASSEFLAVIDKVDKNPKELTDGSIRRWGFGKVILTILAVPLGILILLYCIGITHKKGDAESVKAPTEVSTSYPESDSAVVSPAANAEAPTPKPSLDGFFTGIEHGCQIQGNTVDMPRLVIFDEEDREKFHANNDARKEHPEIFLENPTIHDDGSSVSASIKVNGEFHSIPVSEYATISGKENGISVFQIVFDDGRAEEKLRKSLNFSSVLSEGSGEYIAPAFQTDGKQTTLTCDMSM